MTEKEFKEICLAAKTMIYRGLGSGIIRVMKEGVRVDFVNEESANQFRTIVWRTIQKSESTIQKENSTTQKEDENHPKEEFTTQKEGENHPKEDFTTQKENSTTQKDESTTQKDLTTTQKAVLDYFRNNPKGSRVDAVLAIGGITEDGVKFIIGQLQQLGLLKREGGRKSGTWVVMDKENI